MGTDRISKKEWSRVITWTAILLAISCLPYLIAWMATPPGYQFGGIISNPLDGNSYLGKMRQGWAGSWQFHLTYTPEPHQGASLIYLFYLGLGHLARLTGSSLLLIYHVTRLLGGLTLLIVTYVLLTRLSDDPRERRLGFWLVGLSAGLGWIGTALGAFPIDLWVPEAFTFFSLLTNPHFPLALALMVVVLIGVVWPAGGLRSWLIPGAAALALFLVHPLALIPLYAALGLYLLLKIWFDRKWPWLEFTAATSVGLFSAPLLLWGYWIYSANPIMAAWASQNVTPAPPVSDVVLGYGLVGLLAVPGAVLVARERDRGGLALLAWSIACLVLAYLPFSLQRRFLTGLGLPLAVLASLAVTRWLGPKLSARRERLASVLVVGVSSMGTLFLLAVLSVGVLQRDAQGGLFSHLYLSQDEMTAMEWLLDRAQDEVVLASPRTSMFLPGRAGVRVVAGHPFETIHAEMKEAQVEAFFRCELSDDEWHKIQTDYQIHYVFVGPAEQALGGGELYLGGLVPAFRQGEVTIYRLP
jgi:hypothetical protein